MYINLDRFCFSAFDLEWKATEILKYNLPFSGKNMFRSKGQITKFSENISHENCSVPCYQKKLCLRILVYIIKIATKNINM